MPVYNKNGEAITNDSIMAERALTIGRRTTKRPYWVFHLDCGRKYFSVANIKSMIDAMNTNGVTQLQLHFSDHQGLRFALDDMIMIDVDGNQYDLSPCVSTTLGGSLSEADMDEIIVYAHSKNVDVIPSLDMPGHMGAILTAFPQFRYDARYKWTLDFKSEAAVKFALAIVEKYANYFQSRGCEYWNIGADEVGNTGGSTGRWMWLKEEDITKCVEFVNIVARYISNIGMIPRAFNDGILYFGDYNNLFDKNIEIYDWCSSKLMNEPGIQTVDTLIANGYRVINTPYSWYFVVPGSNTRTRHETLETANLLKVFMNGTTVKDQDGACFCVWCDSDTTDDGGDAALPSIIAALNSFGVGIGLTTQNITYPIVSKT